MSKGLAIEQILYIFLMVVVILVASSFLLKALGIDIFKFIQNIFAPFLTPKAGKVLRIRIDPLGENPEVYEFYLVTPLKESNCKKEKTITNCYKYLQEQDKDPIGKQDTTTYFIIDKDSFERKFCIILSTDEQSGPLKYHRPDLGWIYYIKPGALIQEGCGDNIRECIRDKNFIADGKEGCNPKRDIPDCREAGTHNIVECYDKEAPGPYCDSGKNVENQNFVVTTKDNFKCKDHPTKCNLLFENSYIVRYGIICDENGMWQPCTEERAKKGDIVEGKKCDCEAEICQWK